MDSTRREMDSKMEQSINETEEHITTAMESMYSMMVQMVNHRGAPSTHGLIGNADILTKELTALANTKTSEQVLGRAESAANDSTSAPPSPPLTSIPADIVEYIGRGRNPDIYTREFYELTMRRNQALKGKSESFAMFRDVLMRDLVVVEPELKEALEQVLEKGDNCKV